MDDASQFASEQRKKLERATRLHWFHWLIVILSLALTFGAWYYSKTQVEEKLKLQFTREADQVVALIVERMQKYEDGLWGGVGAVLSHNGKVTKEKWITYSKSISLDVKYPGINGVGIIYYVPKEKLAGFLEYERKTNDKNFRIHPFADRPYYLPITHIKPLKGNEKAVGLDMTFEKNRRAAALKARDTGLAKITGPITLVQDAAKTPGFLFYAPFYRNSNNKTVQARRDNFLGMVYAPFVVKKLMAGTLAREKRHVGVTLADNLNIIYDENIKNDSQYDPNPLFIKKVSLDLYGRKWNFTIRSDRSFRQAASSDQPITILICGIFIDCLLLGLFILLTRSNRKALQYADDVNTELNKKAISLEQSNNDIEQFTYLVSHDLKSPLHNINTLLNFIKSDIKSGNTSEININLKKISGFSERMIMLLNDLMLYASYVSGTYNKKKETVSIGDMLHEITKINNLDDDLLKLDLSVQFIKSEKFLLKSILNNLITNAYKYGLDGDEKQIDILSKKIDDMKIQISVRDYGRGIPQGKEERVFEMFQQLDRQDKEKGSGAGLSIVKKIIINAGGKIWIEHPSDGGAEFIIIWPCEFVTN